MVGVGDERRERGVLLKFKMWNLGFWQHTSKGETRLTTLKH